MHALGFYHEHQRPDRDNFIEIHKWGGVMNEVRKKIDYVWFNNTPSFVNTTYDIKSIMHYDGYMNEYWDARWGAAITDLQGNPVPKNKRLSKLDIETLHKMYPCNNQGLSIFFVTLGGT